MLINNYYAIVYVTVQFSNDSHSGNLRNKGALSPTCADGTGDLRTRSHHQTHAPFGRNPVSDKCASLSSSVAHQHILLQ